jgi:hypothetical protein
MQKYGYGQHFKFKHPKLFWFKDFMWAVFSVKFLNIDSGYWLFEKSDPDP